MITTRACVDSPVFLSQRPLREKGVARSTIRQNAIRLGGNPGEKLEKSSNSYSTKSKSQYYRSNSSLCNIYVDSEDDDFEELNSRKQKHDSRNQRVSLSLGSSRGCISSEDNVNDGFKSFNLKEQKHKQKQRKTKIISRKNIGSCSVQSKINSSSFHDDLQCVILSDKNGKRSRSVSEDLEKTDYGTNSYLQMKEQEKREHPKHDKYKNINSTDNTNTFGIRKHDNDRQDSINDVDSSKLIQKCIGEGVKRVQSTGEKGDKKKYGTHKPVRKIEMVKKDNSYGVIISKRNNRLLVISMKQNSASCQSGLRCFDEILKVNGKCCLGWNSKDVVEKMSAHDVTTLIVQSQIQGIDHKLVKHRFKSNSTLGIDIVNGTIHCQKETPAYKSGLRTGQVVLEVSNTNVFGEKDEFILEIIRKSKKSFYVRTTID
eukprot:Awhi_evm1s15665